MYKTQITMHIVCCNTTQIVSIHYYHLTQPSVGEHSSLVELQFNKQTESQSRQQE